MDLYEKEVEDVEEQDMDEGEFDLTEEPEED